MASSNRHWPSMFKSKPCNAHHHHQWQHDILSSCQIQPYSSAGCEERSPEPKPRWNPKPEQIRILEAIFNSGMVNPPRDEIRRIRAQLQEYGQVGDANVFYWFQNRKSRSKHKQRHLAAKCHAPTITNPAASETTPRQIRTTISTNTTNSSSSIEKTSAETLASLMDQSVNSPLNLTAASINQVGCYQLPTVYQFPIQDSRPLIVQNTPFSTATSSLSELSSLVQVNEQLKQMEKLNVEGSHNQNCTINPTVQVLFLGIADFGDSVAGCTKLTAFINDLAFQVAPTLLNVREAFGENAVLLHSSGHPVMTDEFGVTLHPLQNGGFYYLV